MLKQRLNDVQSGVGATATRADVEPPRTELFVDSCSVISKTSGQLLREHKRNPHHLDLHPRTRHREMFMRQDCYACTPLAHLDLSPCAKTHVPAKRLLRSHAGSTVGSLSVRKETCSCDNTAAFARCEHTWISLRAQRDMFWRKNCCVLTPGAQLDLSACANRHVHATTLLRPRCEHTWISLRAQRDMFRRKNCCVLTPAAQLDLFPCAKKHVPSKRLLRSCTAPQDRLFFSCGRQIQFLQSSAHTSLTLSGTRDPKPQSPRFCFTYYRPHERMLCWGNSSNNTNVNDHDNVNDHSEKSHDEQNKVSMMTIVALHIASFAVCLPTCELRQSWSKFLPGGLYWNI